ncbi:hypothetical protein Ae201684P_012186 [Aphanomyces euteiches]|uniref:Protein kinase domain-containing protein n=1 Tax=Aphanomyces euteiches TaxID=100861 RepID=A0A6G0W9R2_9STRA|nr:hypothetical protein Ae201684_017313 [Aphanomyces euteiches]KAH9081214.1 hypothetical protein Ae201684P_012186 [Aphanomyces euteiches]KAH9145126.1 hypothetical protein AeRB84_010941 [Aphanomyces euteiches]
MSLKTVYVEMAVRDNRGTKRLTVVKSSEPARVHFTDTSPPVAASTVIEQYHHKKLNSTFMPFISRGKLLARVQESGRKHYRPVLDLQNVKHNDTLIYHPCAEMQALLEKNKCLTPAPPRKSQEMTHTPTKTLKRKDRSLSEDRLRAFMQLSSSSGSYMDPTESSRGSADDLSDEDVLDAHGKIMKPKLSKSSSKIRDVHKPTTPTNAPQQVDMLSKNFAQLDVVSDDDEAVNVDIPDIFMSYHPRRNPVAQSEEEKDDDMGDVFLTSSAGRPSIGSPSILSLDSTRGSSPSLVRKSRPSLESMRTSRQSSDVSMSDLTMLDSFDENTCYYTGFSYRDSLRESITVRSDFDAVYQLGKQLGKGNFSVVYEAARRDRPTKKVAVKIIDKLEVHEPRFLFREIEILSSLYDDGVVHLLELYENADHLYLVLELCGRELFDYIDEHGPLTEVQANGLIRKLLRTVSYLHQQAIVHRDIKPENILLVNRDSLDEVKLSDFGIARRLHDGGNRTPHTIAEDQPLRTSMSDLGGQPRERYARAHTQCGTRDYIAPEVMTGKGYGVEADMWSVGVVLYVILSGFAPSFSPDLELVFGEECWQNVSEGAKDMMRRLLVRNPETRMTAAQALQHPWFQL